MKRLASHLLRAVFTASLLVSALGGVARADDGINRPNPNTVFPEDPGLKPDSLPEDPGIRPDVFPEDPGIALEALPEDPGFGP